MHTLVDFCPEDFDPPKHKFGVVVSPDVEMGDASDEMGEEVVDQDEERPDFVQPM